MLRKATDIGSRTIILWDIDNTLLNTGGAGRPAMARAFLELYGVANAFGQVEVSGRSDGAIFRDTFAANGIALNEGERARFVDAYALHLTAAMHERSGRLMPGIEAALSAFSDMAEVTQGLGTGNLRRTGEAKLVHYGIADYFPGMVGGFGDDHDERNELIRIGIERLRNGARGSERVVIIGDTPHDVAAAKANGAYALGVATGKDSAENLLACGADAALEDLVDTETVLRLVLGGA
jgi:phosphoglycolate phosphatase-like HAD superfamily hydrolase